VPRVKLFGELVQLLGFSSCALHEQEGDRCLFTGCIQKEKQLCFQSHPDFKLSQFCTHNVPNRTHAVFRRKQTNDERETYEELNAIDSEYVLVADVDEPDRMIPVVG
jgi:hypothetical protein